jgi:3' terminal RNA ribose 2'-O-methyltransferase Hen1
VLLTIESDNSDMSYLLHKHPKRLHTDTTTFGTAHVFYPKDNKVALLLEIDPLRLTRRGGADDFALEPYVNDRPYVASSFLSVALNQLLRTAVAGRCQKRPELVEQPMMFTVEIPALPSRGGPALLESLFGPLGYQVTAERVPLDDNFPNWEDSVYCRTVLRAACTLSSLLRHLYVLLPVLDNKKHYWVGQDEIAKLLDKGEEWLADHPQRELIIRRYLKHQRGLTQQAMDALSDEEEADDYLPLEEVTEKKLGLHDLRLDAVADILKDSGANQVADLGCGEGKLVRRLLKENQFSRIVAVDVSLQALQRAEQSLERVHEKKREKVELRQGSVLYADDHLRDIEAACLVEVIEHIEPDRLPRVAHNLFCRIRPRTLVLTTPNRDYNVLWESLPAGKFRHRDHRFEWSRQEFQTWVDEVKHDYQVTISGLGEEHPEHGSPTQMAVFRL